MTTASEEPTSRDLLPFPGRPIAESEQLDPLDRRLVFWLGIVLVGLVGVVFHPVVGFKLLTWDDNQHIVENPYFDPISPTNLLHFWGYSYIYLYIPVSYTFFGLEAWLAQLLPSGDPTEKFNPAVFHFGNLLLHIGCTLLVYRLLLRCVRHAPAAFVGTLLFAVHPLQVESVAWVGETRGTLAALFSLLALHKYLDFVGVDAKRGVFAADRANVVPGRPADYGWATFAFALALLSKPSAAALPPLAMLVDCVLLRSGLKDSARRLAPWFVAAAAITGLTKYYQKSEQMHPTAVTSFAERPFTAGDAYAFYLTKLVHPGEMGFDYGRTPGVAAASPGYRWAWLLPTLIVALLVLDGRRRRVWLGAFGFFLLALVPVSGLIPFLYQSISTVADRYVYVPLVGLALLFAAWVATCRRPGLVFVVALPALAWFAGRAYDQTWFWRDDAAFYRQGLRVNPQSFMACLHVGGNFRRERQYAAAVDWFRRMLAIRPDYYTTHTLIGLCLLELDRPAEAEAEFRRTLETNPYDCEGRWGLGRAQAALGDLADAESSYRRAAEADPKSAEPQLLLGELYAEREQWREAEAAFAAALASDDVPLDVHLRYGRALAKAERYADAIREFSRAAALRPDSAAARYELATALYRQGKFAAAIDAAQAGLRLDPDDFGTLQTLGMAELAAGRNADAAVTLERALRRASPASPQAVAVRSALASLRR